MLPCKNCPFLYACVRHTQPYSSSFVTYDRGGDEDLCLILACGRHRAEVLSGGVEMGIHRTLRLSSVHQSGMYAVRLSYLA